MPVLFSPRISRLRCRHLRPAPRSPAPSPRCPILYSFRAAPARSEDAPPTPPQPFVPHGAALRTPALRGSGGGGAGAPIRAAGPPPPPLPPHQHRVGARRNGVNAPCSALAADRHLAPRSQICRASISPPSADLRLGSVVLPCWFFFSLPTVHLHHRGGKTFGEGWL